MSLSAVKAETKLHLLVQKKQHNRSTIAEPGILGKCWKFGSGGTYLPNPQAPEVQLKQSALFEYFRRMNGENQDENQNQILHSFLCTFFRGGKQNFNFSWNRTSCSLPPIIAGDNLGGKRATLQPCVISGRALRPLRCPSAQAQKTLKVRVAAEVRVWGVFIALCLAAKVVQRSSSAARTSLWCVFLFFIIVPPIPPTRSFALSHTLAYELR